MKPRVKVKAASRWTAEVVHLVREIDPDVISALRNVMDLAEQGEIVSVAIAGVRPNGDMATCYAIGANAPALLGAMHVIADRVTAHYRAGYTEHTDGH